MKKLIYLAIIIFSSCSLPRAILYNSNVYQTKDTLDLLKAYDYSKNKIIAKDPVVYRLLPDSGRSIRYTLQKPTDPEYIHILPRLRFAEKVAEVTPTGIKSVQYIRFSSLTPTDNPTDFYYKLVKKTEDLTPEQQILVSEHITGLPFVIPFKFRFNVPSTLDIVNVNASIAYAFGIRLRVGDPYSESYIRLIPLAIGLSEDTYLNRDSVFIKGYKGQTHIAFTYALGSTVELKSGFNFGLFVGWDRMFGAYQNWYYQNKPWLGVGFGFKFGTDK